jgi:hypothetical protein
MGQRLVRYRVEGTLFKLHGAVLPYDRIEVMVGETMVQFRGFIGDGYVSFALVPDPPLPPGTRISAVYRTSEPSRTATSEVGMQFENDAFAMVDDDVQAPPAGTLKIVSVRRYQRGFSLGQAGA